MKISKFSKMLAVVLSLITAVALVPITSMEVKAANNWTPSNTVVNSTVMRPGDMVQYFPTNEDDSNWVSVTYYDENGNWIDSDGDTNGLYIGNNSYSQYKLTGKTVSDTTFQISLTGIKEKAVLTSIYIDHAPNKTSYTEGESFDKNGMVVTAYYTNGSSATVGNYSVNPSSNLRAGTSSVTISYSEGGVTRTATQGISVQQKARNKYIIQPSTGPNGTISPSNAQTVNQGDDRTFNMIPNSGYRVEKVVVDGANQGAINSYTFSNISGGHSISVYFAPVAVTTYPLNIAGSFASSTGQGNYAAGTYVTINAGAVPGYTFTGWTTSDGRTLTGSVSTFAMPAYALNVTANWAPSGGAAPVPQAVTTVNLKGTQVAGWDGIAAKLAALKAKDVKTNNKILYVATSSSYCYVPKNVIDYLSVNKGTELHVNAGTDVAFSFFSDQINTAYAGTNLAYSAVANTVGGVRQMTVDFAEKGAIGTNIAMHVKLPGAVPGQQAYVYLDNAGTKTLYLPVTVGASGTADFAVIAKAKMVITY